MKDKLHSNQADFLLHTGADGKVKVDFNYEDKKEI